MQKTRSFNLTPLFSRTALGWVVAITAAATGCSDDGSTDTEASAGSAGRVTMTPPAAPPATTPPTMTPPASTPPTTTPPAAPPATTPPPAPELPPGTYAVCARPESAYFDAGTSAWYVSCMAGSVADDGYVTKLSADATEVVTEKFVTGIDEPKGIRVNDGKLYVSNVNELVTADLATGETLATTTIVGIDPRVPENSSLNDVTVDPVSGNVYVSDNRNDLLYRFDANGETPEILVAGPVLEGPNGLLIDIEIRPPRVS